MQMPWPVRDAWGVGISVLAAAGCTAAPKSFFFFWLRTSSSPGTASYTSAQLGFGIRKLTHKPLNIYNFFSK